MKRLWGIVIFLATFQGIVLMVNVLDVFPNEFYSDVELPNVNDPENLPTSEEWFFYFFDPGIEIPLLGDVPGTSGRFNSMIVLIIAFMAIGSIVAWKTHSWLPLVIAMLGYSVFTMIIKSKAFFDKMFLSWDSQALTYLSLTLGLAMLILFFVTILETATHGEA
jgi:hypothetical protein